MFVNDNGMLMIILTMILVGVTILAWYRFRWSVVVLSAMLPVYMVRFRFMGIPTNLFEFSVVIVAFCGVVTPPIRQQMYHFLKTIPTPLRLAIVMFIAAAAISVSVSPSFIPLTVPDVIHSLGVFKGWIVTPILFAFLVGTGGIRLQKPALKALLFSGVIVAIIGLGQLPFGGRIHSMYDVPNSLALFLVPLTILWAWGPFRYKRAGVLILLLAIAGTQSIMALVSIGITTIVGIMAYRRPEKLAIFSLVLALTTISVLSIRLPYFLRPFKDPAAHSSLSVRLQLWQIAGTLIKHEPWLGIGLGRFEPAYQYVLHQEFAKGASPLPEFVFRDPHNVLLSFWLNTGIIGVLSFGFIHAWIIQNSFKNSSDIQKAALLALFSLGILGLADTIYWKNDLAALHWLLITLLSCLQLRGLNHFARKLSTNQIQDSKGR